MDEGQQEAMRMVEENTDKSKKVLPFKRVRTSNGPTNSFVRKPGELTKLRWNTLGTVVDSYEDSESQQLAPDRNLRGLRAVMHDDGDSGLYHVDELTEVLEPVDPDYELLRDRIAAAFFLTHASITYGSLEELDVTKIGMKMLNPNLWDLSVRFAGRMMLILGITNDPKRRMSPRSTAGTDGDPADERSS